MKPADDRCFISDAEWSRLLAGEDSDSFDYIVVGSGFCAFAFVERIHRCDARILILEGGTLDFEEHLKNIEGETYYEELTKNQRWFKKAIFI